MTSGDRPVRGRTAGSRDTVQRAAHTAACPSDSTTSSLTLTICPAWPGFWTQAPGWKELDCPGYVLGLARAAEGETAMPELTRRYTQALGQHLHDRTIGGQPG